MEERRLSVEEQKEYAKRIGLIIEKKIGAYFFNELQGGGKAFFLKIVVSHGNERFLNKARTLLSELVLTPEKINKHGVGGHKYTLIYELFSISLESQEKINNLVKEIIDSLKSKPQNVSGKTEEISKIITTSETLHTSSLRKRQRKPIEAKCKGELSNFLNARLSTMGINPEVYPFCDLNQTFIVRCRNERIAKEIESLLTSVCVRDGSSVMVELKEFWNNFQNTTISAPDSSYSKESLLMKILKVNRTFTVDFREDGVFLKLRRRDSLGYALENFKANGWSFSTNEDGVLLHYCLQTEDEKEELPQEAPKEDIPCCLQTEDKDKEELPQELPKEDILSEVIGKLKRLLSLDLSPEIRRQIVTAINDQEARQLLKRLKDLC